MTIGDRELFKSLQMEVDQQQLEQERRQLRDQQAVKLSLPALVRTSHADLHRMVGGLKNTVTALNEYLVDLLLERDDLLGHQDELLEEISEATDALLEN